ncbi:MAG: hypothetical protein JRF54_07770, partial [Deltaproteobacteria bacterium]|nr:hypothetical protein [Deltaproteobacteria bacterium]
MTSRGDSRWNRIALGLWLAAGLSTFPARAQQSPIPAPAADVSPELTEVERKVHEARSRLAEWQSKAAEYLSSGQDAQARTRAIEEDIARLEQRKAITIPGDASAAELSAELLEADQDLTAARREAIELDVEADRRAERRKRIPELLSIAKQRLKALGDAPSPPSGDSSMAGGLRELASLRRTAGQTEIAAYQNELATYDVRGALLSKRRDRATLRIAYYQALTGKLREAQQQLERLEVERDNEATRRLLAELMGLPDAFKRTLQELYQRNEALASVLTSEGGVHEQIEDVSG